MKLWKSIIVGRWYYLAAIPFQSTVDICFTLAFVYTTAAKALLLINLNPLWCAIIGRLFLGDKLPSRTYIALGCALCCMVIIFVPEVVTEKQNESMDGLEVEEEGAAAIEDSSTSESNDTSTKGNIIALFTGFVLAGFISIVRKGGKSSKEINLIGAAALGAGVSSIVSLIVRKGNVLPTPFWNASELWTFWLAVVGQGFGIGIIFVTMTVAPRLITGAEIGLCVLLEAVLGPLFVFLAYGDVPSKWTLIGGSLLLLVLAIHESRPLFEKAKELHRSISMRLSSRSGGVSTTDHHVESGEKLDGKKSVVPLFNVAATKIEDITSEQRLDDSEEDDNGFP